MLWYWKCVYFWGGPLNEIHDNIWLLYSEPWQGPAQVLLRFFSLSDKSSLPRSHGNIFSSDVIRLPCGEGLEGARLKAGTSLGPLQQQWEVIKT